jgi:hypothetical protein
MHRAAATILQRQGVLRLDKVLFIAAKQKNLFGASNSESACSFTTDTTALSGSVSLGISAFGLQRKVSVLTAPVITTVFPATLSSGRDGEIDR